LGGITRKSKVWASLERNDSSFVALLHGFVYLLAMMGYPRRKKSVQAPWDPEKVRALRQHLQLSQAEMADQLGTRQQTISEWERGTYSPRGISRSLLSRIAEEAGFFYRQTGDDLSGGAEQG
jgi:DNA-binding XRE family transcriptional regulator